MNSNVEVRVIQPSNIEVQQYDLQVLLLDAGVLSSLMVKEGVVDFIYKQVGFLML